MSLEESKYEYTKTERLKSASEDDRLERHRFTLSDDPELRGKLRQLREVFHDLKEKYPKLIDIGLYGSQIKGYATPESDFEGLIFVELDKPGGDEHDRGFNVSHISHAVDQEIRRRLKLPIGQANFRPEFTDLSALDRTLRTADRFAIRGLAKYFYFSLGGGLKPYREKIISWLESQGEIGEDDWHDIMDELSEWENGTFTREVEERRKELYPWKLSEARSYFGLPRAEA
jgi:hypothetical protein